MTRTTKTLTTTTVTTMETKIILITTTTTTTTQRRGRRWQNSSGNNNSNKENLRIRGTVITALKLVIVYGLLDVFGFFHLPFKSMIGAEMNVVLGFIYSTVRSLRGLFFFIIYICKKSVLQFYINLVTRIINKRF